MERSSTAREALVAELIGDLAKLLERVDTLAPAIEKTRREATAAAHELAASLGPFRAHIEQIANETKKTSVQHVVRCVNEAGARILEVQTQAMSASAKAMFEQEVGPRLRQLASKLEQLAADARRPWWESWGSYAATALASAICSAALVLYVVYR